ncbi:hypothetical protein LINPERHAP1_LOCUS40646 [Linum perenne]
MSENPDVALRDSGLDHVGEGSSGSEFEEEIVGLCAAGEVVRDSVADALDYSGNAAELGENLILCFQGGSFVRRRRLYRHWGMDQEEQCPPFLRAEVAAGQSSSSDEVLKERTSSSYVLSKAKAKYQFRIQFPQPFTWIRNTFMEKEDPQGIKKEEEDEKGAEIGSSMFKPAESVNDGGRKEGDYGSEEKKKGKKR